MGYIFNPNFRDQLFQIFPVASIYGCISANTWQHLISSDSILWEGNIWFASCDSS